MANSRKRGMEAISRHKVQQRGAAKLKKDWQKGRDDATTALLNAAWDALQSGDLTRMVNMITLIIGVNLGVFTNQALEEAGLETSKFSNSYRYFSNVSWWAMGIVDMAVANPNTKQAKAEHAAHMKSYGQGKKPKRIGMLYEDDDQLLWGFESFKAEFLTLRRRADGAKSDVQLRAICEDAGVSYHADDDERQLKARIRNHVQWSFLTADEKKAITGVDDNTGTTGDGVTGEEYNEMLEVE